MFEDLFIDRGAIASIAPRHCLRIGCAISRIGDGRALVRPLCVGLPSTRSVWFACSICAKATGPARPTSLPPQGDGRSPTGGRCGKRAKPQSRRRFFAEGCDGCVSRVGWNIPARRGTRMSSRSRRFRRGCTESAGGRKIRFATAAARSTASSTGSMNAVSPWTRLRSIAMSHGGGSTAPGSTPSRDC